MCPRFLIRTITLLFLVIPLCPSTKVSSDWIPVTWRLLGSGSQGSVFLAPSEHDPSVMVAVKVRDSLDAASQEAAILSQLDHPGIPKLLSYRPGSTFLTMEYIEGQTLSNVSWLTEDTVIAIIRGIANILAHLHAKFVAHQDLGLDNIMLTSAGRVKLVDFGTAVSFAPDPEGYPEPFTQIHHWETCHINDVWILQRLLIQLGHAGSQDPRDLTPRLQELYNCLAEYALLRNLCGDSRRSYLRRC